MKTKTAVDARTVLKELQRLPNVGPRTADDLLRLGIRRAEDLKKRTADDLYEAICKLDGTYHDPCVWDVFASLVDFAQGKPARRWWDFTAIRKKRDAGKNPTAPFRLKASGR
jgi:hypothetical protein